MTENEIEQPMGGRVVLLCSMRTKEPKSRRAEDWKEALLREEKKKSGSE